MATTSEILYGEDNLWKLQREAASQVISEKITEMQRLYQEVIALADENGIYVNTGLLFPDDLTLGHNSSMRAEVYWSPSAQYC